MRRRAASLCVLWLMVAAPAVARGAWSAPVALGPPVGDAKPAGLTVASSGGAQFAWTAQTPPAGGGVATAASPPANNGFEGRTGLIGVDGLAAATRRFRRTVVAGPAALPGGGVLLLSTEVGVAAASVPNASRLVRLRLERLDARGRLQRTRILVSRAIVSSTALSADAYGRAVAAWSEVTPSTVEVGPEAFKDHYALRTVSVTSAGRLVGRPRTLERTAAFPADYGGEIAMGAGPSGDAVIAFATVHGRSRTVDAFVRDRIGAFGPRIVVGPHEGTAQLAATNTARKRVVIVWGAQDGGEEANMPWRIRSAVIASGRVVGRQLLDPGDPLERPVGTVAVAALPDGRVAAGWSAIARVGHPVRVAISSPAGQFGAPEELAPDAALGGLSAASDGRLLATWSTIPDDAPANAPSTQALATVRLPAAATFGPSEAIAPPDVAGPPLATFLPDGRAVAIWSARPNGIDPSLGVQATSVLRLAVRPAAG